jgi:hypothetical protein
VGIIINPCVCVAVSRMQRFCFRGVDIGGCGAPCIPHTNGSFSGLCPFFFVFFSTSSRVQYPTVLLSCNRATGRTPCTTHRRSRREPRPRIVSPSAGGHQDSGRIGTRAPRRLGRIWALIHHLSCDYPLVLFSSLSSSSNSLLFQIWKSP